jgi:hypothetical protein
MHERERLRSQIGEFTNRCSGGWRDAAGMKHFLGSFGGLDDIRIRQCRDIAGMSEEISAEQSARGFFKYQYRFPGVRHMRRVDMAYTFPSEIDDFTIVKRTGRAVRQVVEGHHDASLTMSNLRFWRGLQPLVHRTTFVRFHVSESDPPEFPIGMILDSLKQEEHGADRWKAAAPRPNQELIERESRQA